MTSCYRLLLLFSGCVLFTCPSAQNSCKSRCGEDYVRSITCNCDYECLIHKECCKDYESVCTTKDSCKGRCGESFKRGRKCDCDEDCIKYLKCCPDYKNYCNILEPTKPINMSSELSEPEKQPSQVSEEPTASVPSSTNSFFTSPSSQPLIDTKGPQATTIPPQRSTIMMVIAQQPSKQPETIIQALEQTEFKLETNPPSTTVPGNTPATHNTETISTDSTDKPEKIASTIHPEIIIPTTIPTNTSEQTRLNTETNPPSTSEPKPNPSTDAQAKDFGSDSTTKPSDPEQTDQNPNTNPPSTSEPKPNPSTDAQAKDFGSDSTTKHSDPEQTDQNPNTNSQSTSESESSSATSTQANDNPTTPINPVTKDPKNNPKPDNNIPSKEADQSAAPSDKPGTSLTSDVPNEDDFLSQRNDSNTATSVEDDTPTTSGLDDNNYQADENYDTNICSGQPVNGLTTLRNGTIVVFRGHYFWILDDKRKPGPAQLIKDVWGIPSPIDTVFTRCNCQGKTYFFKGNDYWRFENDVMDSGYPKPVSEGFGLKGRVIAALSMPHHRRRRESVFFFKKGGLAQRYTYHVTPNCGRKPAVYLTKRRFRRAADSELGLEININIWRGFPSTVTSAVSVPTTGGDGYSYYVFSPTKYYSLNVEGETPVILPPKGGPDKQRSAKSWFGCPEANIV